MTHGGDMNFSNKEMQCPCCQGYRIEPGLLILLEDLRLSTGPIHINSAYRCELYNEVVGGVDSSYHLTGRAADISTRHKTPKEVVDILNNKPYRNLLGVGLYNTFVHIDLRGVRAAWIG